MGEVIKIITQSLGNVLSSYFGSDMDVMSDNAKRIFSNKDDREKYIKAVEEMKNDSNITEKTITLSNNEQITLVS